MEFSDPWSKFEPAEALCWMTEWRSFALWISFVSLSDFSRCGIGSVELKIASALWDTPRTDLQLLSLFYPLLTVFLGYSKVVSALWWICDIWQCDKYLRLTTDAYIYINSQSTTVVLTCIIDQLECLSGFMLYILQKTLSWTYRSNQHEPEPIVSWVTLKKMSWGFE